MKLNLAQIKDTAVFAANRGKLIVGKHSPEILMVVGIGAAIGSTVLACRATLKLNDILDEAKEVSDTIEKAHNGDISLKEEYTDDAYRRDVVVHKIQTAAKIGKLYAPAAGLGLISVTCLLGAHGIMQKRNLALLAAYKTCEEAFNSYRDRVKEELGEDKDRQFFLGFQEETVKEKIVGPDGKKKTVTKKIETIKESAISQYSRFFDETNKNWSHSPSQNRFFLQQVQAQLNDDLIRKGHLFLNDVYDALGFEPTPEGQLVGWIYDPKGVGTIDDPGRDNEIKFFIYDATDPAKRDFVNGYNPSILIDLNPDGVVYDLI